MLETFWQNLYLRGQMLHDWTHQLTWGAYGQPGTVLPFSRGYVIDADMNVVMPFFAHHPQEITELIYELLADMPPAIDLNGDGAVDAADLALLLGSWGSCASCPADFNQDGAVNAADLAMLLGNWG